jgi:predicted TIM-barrel fold metal-dependent hydrolase
MNEPMTIVDSHCHLKHGDAAATEYSAEAIVEVMDAVGIARSVVFAMSTTTARSIEMAQRAVEAFPERLIPYAYALPRFDEPVLPQIEHAIRGLGFRGIKIHAAECLLAERVLGPVLELAAQERVPCLIDCSGNARAAERLVQAFPKTPFILAHLGRYLCTDEALIDRFIAIAQAHPNVYLDISGVVLTWKAGEAIRLLGARRVLFGIDGPHPQPDTRTMAETELDKIANLRLSPADAEEVLGRAVLRLIG